MKNMLIVYIWIGLATFAIGLNIFALIKADKQSKRYRSDEY